MLKPKVMDYVLIIFFGLLAVGIFVLNIYLNSEPGSLVEISYNGNLIKTLSLDKDTSYLYQAGEDMNLIIVKDGSVTMKEANCRDQICVYSAPISKAGESIICLPHKLSLRITGNAGEVDSYVK